MEPADELATSGRAVAGSPASIFAVDVGAAEVMCASCGVGTPLADEKSYLRGAGSLLHCRHCSSVLGRFRRAQDTIWIDLDSLAAWQLVLPH